MGYLITAGSPPVHGESITDDQWRDIAKHASDAGFCPHPSLEKKEAVDLSEEDAKNLYTHLDKALETSLKDAPLTAVEGANQGVLDRETVLRVSHVLRYLDYQGVRLTRTPSWKAGG